MSDKSLEVAVSLRAVGAGKARILRKNRQVPAVVYGKNQKTLALLLDIGPAEKYSKKEYENKIFTFKSKDKALDGLKVLKKEVSWHKLTRKPLHIDFFSLDMKKPVRVNVEILFTGKARGVKEAGGILNILRRNVEVECLPGDIPSSLSIDVSPLGINQNFHVQDLKIPEKVKLITSTKAVLCAVSEIAEEEVKPAETTAAAEDKTTTTDKPAAEGASADSGQKSADAKSAAKAGPEKPAGGSKDKPAGKK